MALLNNPRIELGLDEDPATLARITNASNHDTSLAGWAVCVMGIGTLLELPKLAALSAGPRMFFAALLVPLILGAYQSVQHLHRASAGISEAVSAPQLLAGLQTRRYWAYRAQNWALVTILGFGLWTLALQFLG
jgi:hypothetical protein